MHDISLKRKWDNKAMFHYAVNEVVKEADLKADVLGEKYGSGIKLIQEAFSVEAMVVNRKITLPELSIDCSPIMVRDSFEAASTYWHGLAIVRPS